MQNKINEVLYVVDCYLSVCSVFYQLNLWLLCRQDEVLAQVFESGARCCPDSILESLLCLLIHRHFIDFALSVGHSLQFGQVTELLRIEFS